MVLIDISKGLPSFRPKVVVAFRDIKGHASKLLMVLLMMLVLE